MRDDFTAKTKEILAKRVGYLCSNPVCRKHTVGPNSNEEKATSIGVAAHITAASLGGPRFDENLTVAGRKNIKNGIWLCANCSILIDRDVITYKPNLIKSWKKDAEDNMLKAIQGNVTYEVTPFIEVDLIWSYGGRNHQGYSSKNNEVFTEPIPAETDLYVNWQLCWNFSFVIHNNSETPAYNISINESSQRKFSHIEKIAQVNNLEAFRSIELNSTYEKYFHGTSKEADKVLSPYIPDELNGLELEIIYYDNKRNQHTTIFKIENGTINNRKK